MEIRLRLKCIPSSVSLYRGYSTVRTDRFINSTIHGFLPLEPEDSVQNSMFNLYNTAQFQCVPVSENE